VNTSPPMPPGRRFPGCVSPIHGCPSRSTAHRNSPMMFPKWKSAKWTAWTATIVLPTAIVPPDYAVNLAMEAGQIDRTMPWIKTNAVYALTRKYKSDDEARDGIATLLAARYPNDPRRPRHNSGRQKIYTNNFFPQMSRLECLSGQMSATCSGPLFPLPRRQPQGGRRPDRQGQRLQRLSTPSWRRAARGNGENDAGRPALQASGWNYDLSCSDCHTGGRRFR